MRHFGFNFNKLDMFFGNPQNNRLMCFGLFFLLTITAAFLFFGCAMGPQRQPEMYVPGVYKGVGEGMHGDIVVETEFSAFKIISVKVVQQEDTPNISDMAVERIPAAVVEAQTSAVDAVSGATETSEGIMAAVQSTISQALRK